MKGCSIAVRSVVCLIWLAACASVAPPPAPEAEPRVETIYVVSNGWHAAIVVAQDDLARTGLVPEAGDFPQAAFYEFGWGDRTYYPAKDKTVAMTLAATIIPTPAIMHLAGLARPPNETYPAAEVMIVTLTRTGFRELIEQIDATFERDAGGRTEAVSRGLYLDSNFYPAHGRFHLFNTCNTWVARLMQDAGVDISPSGVISADELVSRLRTAPGVAVLAR